MGGYNCKAELMKLIQWSAIPAVTASLFCDNKDDFQEKELSYVALFVAEAVY